MRPVPGASSGGTDKALVGLVRRGSNLIAVLDAHALLDAAASGGEIIVGLITKTETNPFFVKMKEGAQAKADELKAKLLTGAGEDWPGIHEQAESQRGHSLGGLLFRSFRFHQF